MQYNTSVFCNPCDNGSNRTRSCNAQKCHLFNMEPQYFTTVFEQDNEQVKYYIMGGNDNRGEPAFQINELTGALATLTLINFELGPRTYSLQVDLVDVSVKLPGIQRTSVVFNITIVNVNDPPLLYSPNVTYIPENKLPDEVVYRFVPMDEDNDTVSCFIVGNNNNTAVPRGNGTFAPAFAVNASSCEMFSASPIDYEPGPRRYDLLVHLRDYGLTTVIVMTVFIVGAYHSTMPLM